MGLEERAPVEAAKVRLVRCPKCENLLPELPDFPLYRCGGCGAVLKAKKIGFLEDGIPEISEAVEGARISDEGGVRGCSKLGVDTITEPQLSEVEKIHSEKVVSDGCSASRAEDAEVVSDFDITRRGKERIRRMERKEDDYESLALGLVGSMNQGRKCDLSSSGIEYTNFNGERAMKEMRHAVELSKQWSVMDQLDVVASHEPAKNVTPQLRPRNFLHHVEGPSNREMNSSFYEYGEKTRYQDQNLDGLARVKNLENDRVKLLRRLDELNDEISRSGDAVDKQKEMIYTDRRMDFPTPPDPFDRHRANYAHESYSHGASKQPLTSSYDMESPYLNRTPGFIPCSDMYASNYLGSYPRRGLPYECLGNGDAHRTKLLGRPPLEQQSQCMHQQYYDKFPGYYGDINRDHFMLHQREDLFHQPACSFAQCNKNWRTPPNADHSGFRDQRFPKESYDSSFHHSMKATRLGLQGYSFGGSNLYHLPSRKHMNLNSSDHDHRRNATIAHRSGRVCHPVAGGAPFITCCNCFELLKLPQKCVSSAKMQHKIKCGACSSTISFEVGDTGFVGSVSLHVEQVPTEIDNGSGGTMDENVAYWPGDSNSAEMNCCSNDFNDLQAKFSPTDKKSDSGGSDKLLDPLSSNSSFLENSRDQENTTSRKHGSSLSSEFPPEETKFSSHTESSTKKCPNNCSDINAAGQSDKGNKSKRSEKERVALDRITSRKNSVTDAAMASEMDVPSNGFPNSYVETSKEEHQKATKGGDSFFAGLIKKSFRDFTKSSQIVEGAGSQVFVNGHVIPDRALKKAEKLAGPVHPGEYWYDIRAGFWGVIGHPCLGIIMPDIEEFNYPIRENCAAGNTGVFINGRELHQKDLDLLTARGLPVTRNRSYTIDISGKVIDEQTGEELDGLGKLAPTVERAKHGFGMKVPAQLA